MGHLPIWESILRRPFLQVKLFCCTLNINSKTSIPLLNGDHVKNPEKHRRITHITEFLRIISAIVWQNGPDWKG